MIKIKAIVLETNEGTFEGNQYRSLVARVDGKLLKFKVDKSLSNIGDYVDQEVELKLDIVKGSNMSATIKVVGVEGDEA